MLVFSTPAPVVNCSCHRQVHQAPFKGSERFTRRLSATCRIPATRVPDASHCRHTTSTGMSQCRDRLMGQQYRDRWSVAAVIAGQDWDVQPSPGFKMHRESPGTTGCQYGFRNPGAPAIPPRVHDRPARPCSCGHRSPAARAAAPSVPHHWHTGCCSRASFSVTLVAP